jgi:GPH family glycoside/pentoside/hexuronide:cation symporter
MDTPGTISRVFFGRMRGVIMGDKTTPDQTANDLKSTKHEKVFFSFGQIAINIVWMLPGSFLTLYYTDSVGLSAAFLGTMMLICRIFDGLSDVLFGMILDKTRTRWGKARPWILFLAVPTVLSLIALFAVPTAFGENAKNVYVFITYFLMTVVTYTGINIAGNAILPRFSLTSQDRSVAIVIGTILSLVTILSMNMVIPIVIESSGGYGSQSAWMKVVLFVSAIALIGFAFLFFGVKERIPLDSLSEKSAVRKQSITEGLRTLLSNRYFYLSLAIFLANNILTGTQGIGIYYARDVFGNASLFGIMSMIGMFPMILFMPFVPMLFKKFGKRNTISAGTLLSIIAAIMMLLNPKNAVWYFIFAFIRGIGSTPMTTAVGTLAGDVVDYNQWKTGLRTEGIAVSVQSIGAKLGTGLGSALLGWILAWGGYNSALETQSASTTNAMIAIGLATPLFVYISLFIILCFWNIEKYQADIMAFIAAQNPKGE